MRLFFLITACCTLAAPAFAANPALALDAPRPMSFVPNYSFDGYRSRGYPGKIAEARMLVAAGRYREADPVVDELLAKAGGPEIQFLKGVTLLGLDQPQAARRYFKAVIDARKTRHAGAMSGLALADVRLGDTDAARGILKTLRSLQTKCDTGCSRATSLDQAVMVVEKALG